MTRLTVLSVLADATAALRSHMVALRYCAAGIAEVLKRHEAAITDEGRRELVGLTLEREATDEVLAEVENEAAKLSRRAKTLREAIDAAAGFEHEARQWARELSTLQVDAMPLPARFAQAVAVAARVLAVQP